MASLVLTFEWHLLWYPCNPNDIISYLGLIPEPPYTALLVTCAALNRFIRATRIYRWTYTSQTSIFTYRTLIPSRVGGAGVDLPTYEMRTIFLMSLALSVPIFNKKSHWTRAVETFKLWSNFETFHRSCPMIFFVENWHNKSQGHKKKCIHFILGRIFPCPLPHSWELGIDR